LSALSLVTLVFNATAIAATTCLAVQRR
jgi:hypothetical protein